MHDPHQANHDRYPPPSPPSPLTFGPSGTPPYPPPMTTPAPGFGPAHDVGPVTGRVPMPPEPPSPDSGPTQAFGNRKLALSILAGLVALFVIISAVFVVLFLNTKADLAATRSTINKHEATINSAEKKLKKLGGTNEDLKDDVDEAEADSKGARECITAFQEWLDEATKKKPDKSTVKDLADKANTACRDYW